MKNKIIFLLNLFAVGFFTLGLGSCIEPQVKSDPEIVVIGNGLESKEMSWQKTLVADVLPANLSGVQSLVVEATNVVPVQAKLQNASDPSSTKLDVAVRLGWIVSGAQDGETVLKLESSSNSTAMDKTESCVFFKAQGKQVSCEHSETLQFSDHKRPEFQKDGSVYFIDASGSLQYSADQKTAILVSKNVRDFFLDKKGSLFFQAEEKTWFLVQKSQLDAILHLAFVTPKPVIRNGLLYRGESGEVYVYALTEMSTQAGALVGAQAARVLYQFDSEQLKFKNLWTAGPEDRFEWNSNGGLQVHGENAILVADVYGVDVGLRKSVIELGPLGLAEIGDTSFLPSDVLVGREKLWIKPVVQNPLKAVGSFCEQNVLKKSFSCKILGVPEGVRVLESILADDQIVLALSRPSAQGVESQTGASAKPREVYEVVVLDSALESRQFGQIVKTWKVSDPVKALRFFDLSSSTKNEVAGAKTEPPVPASQSGEPAKTDTPEVPRQSL
jgi:hypothetical protein